MGTRVYIGGLPYRVKERDIERFFRGYGKLREVLIKNGYGFVEFEDYRDADDAVYELNGKELCGERVTVERAKGSPRARGRDGGRGGGSENGRSPRNGGGRDRFRSPRPSGRGGDNAPPRYGPPTRTDYRLIVENLSSRVSWQDLKDYMRQAGEVTYADAHKQHRNEGVVEFASYSDLKTAIEKLDGTDLNGRRIKLIEDKSRSSRRRSRSRSSSRSRSRSRSRRRSRSRSRSKSHSRSKRSASKSRSRSKSRSPRKSRSKSRSRDKSADRERSKSREKSVDKARDSRDREVSKSRSRSKSPVKSDARSQSRSKSRDKSRSRSRSMSRSRSVSPRRADHDDDEKMGNGDRSSPEHDRDD